MLTCIAGFVFLANDFLDEFKSFVGVDHEYILPQSTGESTGKQ